MRANVEGIETHEELVELLREVKVDQHYKREFLHVLYGFIQKIFHTFDPYRPQPQHQRQNYKHYD